MNILSRFSADDTKLQTTLLMASTISVINSTDDNASNSINITSKRFELPEGYSTPHLVITAALVSIIILIIVFGNFLVVLAIFTDRNLKSKQNWFIASLAVADFLLGLVIVPFSLANELMGYWHFGSIWCDLWKAIDVFTCTASILSICLISLDRYWSITRAIEYSRQRTSTRAALMITAVWVLSAIICVPPLIGWKNPLPVTEYPLCLLSEDVGYVWYSCMGSFYIPAVIMVFVYFKIYQAAKARANRNSRKQKEETTTVSSIAKPASKPAPIVNEVKDAKLQVPDVESPSCLSDDESTWPVYQKQQQGGGTIDEKAKLLSPIINNVVKTENNHTSPTDKSQTQSKEKSEETRENKEKESVPSDCNKNDTGIVNNGQIQGKLVSKAQNSVNSASCNDAVRNLERQKRKLAKARERRATIVLGLVMAAFIVCWFPFFTLYVIESVCDCIPDVVFKVCFWAGYCNSALNPIIYNIFNRDFRIAFKKILQGKISCPR